MKKKLSHIHFTKKQWIILAIGIAVAASLPLFIQGQYPRHVLSLILLWSILGMGWNFLGGYAGQVSVGHAVFYGLGAYSVAVLYAFYAVTPWVGFFVGMLVSVLAAFCIGLPLLRLRGHYFAVATLALAECTRIIFVNWQFVNAAIGVEFLDRRANVWYSLQFIDRAHYHWFFLVVAVIVLLVSIYFDRSRFGYYLRAIKCNQDAAESLGIDTTRYKQYALMLSAAICSLAGGLYAVYMAYVDPPMMFVLRISLMICLVTVMGGLGTIFGPIIGAVILILIQEYSRVFLGGTGLGIDLIIYGVIVVLIVLFLPDGLLSLIPKIKSWVGRSKKGGAAA